MTVIKICGITQPAQAAAIAALGVEYLGFILVPQSPRYVSPDRLREMTVDLRGVEKVGVFLHQDLASIIEITRLCHLTAVQLHGEESPAFCQALKQALPDRLVIKALRIQNASSLQSAMIYGAAVDILLLDAYVPNVAGGTGKTINWDILAGFSFPCSWWLAGGLQAKNIQTALKKTTPQGVDLSSGVEVKPGYKDLAKVAEIIELVKEHTSQG